MKIIDWIDSDNDNYLIIILSIGFLVITIYNIIDSGLYYLSIEPIIIW